MVIWFIPFYVYICKSFSVLGVFSFICFGFNVPFRSIGVSVSFPLRFLTANTQTLQALVACPPMYHLMKFIPLYSKVQRPCTSTPMIDSL